MSREAVHGDPHSRPADVLIGTCARRATAEACARVECAGIGRTGTVAKSQHSLMHSDLRQQALRHNWSGLPHYRQAAAWTGAMV